MKQLSKDIWLYAQVISPNSNFAFKIIELWEADEKWTANSYIIHPQCISNCVTESIVKSWIENAEANNITKEYCLEEASQVEAFIFYAKYRIVGFHKL